jgi:hypothetical protein
MDDAVCTVHWYLFSWNDVLRLAIPPEVRRTEVEGFIDWQADKLARWLYRDPETFGEFPWSWVSEDLAIAQWDLGEWFGIFRDLRIFFCVHPRASGQPLSVHILAVREDGAAYLAECEQELLARREEVVFFLEGDAPDG